MKRIKKVASLVLAMIMVLAMAIPAMAAEGDKTITIKPTTTRPIVEGEVFTAYGILNANQVGDSSEIVYTVPEEMKSFYIGRYGLTGSEKDFAYQVTQKIADETDIYAFARDAIAAAKTAGMTGVSGEKSGANYVISNLAVGYYVIGNTLPDGAEVPVSQVILDTTTTNLEIVIKADQPTIDKKIDGATDTDPDSTGLVENNNAAVGDVVPYVVTSQVPAMSGYNHYRFVMVDTLSKGLTLVNNADGDAVTDENLNASFTIKIGNMTLTPGTNYEVTKTPNQDGTTELVITFKNFIQWKTDDYIGQTIDVRYFARVNDDAVIGSNGNENTVKLYYSNNPSNEGEGTPDTLPDDRDILGSTEDIDVRTYVVGLALFKHNANNESLEGAEFTLYGTRVNRVKIDGNVYVEDANGTYWKLNDGSYTDTDPETPNLSQEAKDKYSNDGKKYKLQTVNTYQDTEENVTVTAVTTANGKIVFTGLAAGTYTITEVKAPNGYNKLSDPITVTIGQPTYNADKTCTWTGSYTLGTTTSNLALENDASGNGILTQVDVLNNTGTELPSTGGIGTTIFYVIGGILVVGAGILLVTKKRMSAR